MNTLKSPLPHGISSLPQLGVIRVEGAHASVFLHSQLTQDFSAIGPDQARLAGFLSAKGRLQASFIGIQRSATEVLLVCSLDLLAATLKRLSMFVLRAQAKLSDASADFMLRGLVGEPLQSLLGEPSAEQLPAWSKRDIGAQSLVMLYPALSQPRALWLAPVGHQEPSGPALAHALWQWGEVRSGVATLSLPLVDQFVPQMLNYESIGGVNFQKGCYPGQEIVARSQFRGTLKRRTYLVHAAQPLHVGQEVFGAADAEQACGSVVQVAPAPSGGFDALASLQIAAAEAGGLRAGPAPDAAALDVLTRPYALLEDI